MATGFYYLAAAPPAGAAVDVCGPGNFSSDCVPNSSPSPKSPTSSTGFQGSPIQKSPATPDPVPQLPIVESPAPIVEPAAAPAVESPAPTPNLIPLLPEIDVPAATIQNPIAPAPPSVPIATTPTFQNIYTNAAKIPRATSIPEPGTVAALLATGVGIICSGRKRNKQVGQPR
ncbi:PEP-CTERM sorting domain-containing protein [Microcoleus sp. LEGE 07076]|nr:PEP-CTERM sorting domain-containing protein [Microcoleus sp. LEGE 07076]